MMKNKGAVMLLGVVITLLCLFYLSFTIISRNEDKKAEEAATENGVLNYAKKKAYLDSMYNKTVYDLGIFSFTLEEVKNKELNLGLDLQGGMHLTIEVSPVEILRSLSGNSNNKVFKEAIAEAKSQQASSQESFIELFFASVERKDPAVLKNIFVNAKNKGRINFKSTNAEIKTYIREETESAVDRAYEIIRTRIDKYGVTQPNIQRIEGTGRIQIELPGVDDPDRVRDLVEGVAKLEFYEVWSFQDIIPQLQEVNTYWVNNKMKFDKKDETKGDSSSSEGNDLFVEEGAETDEASADAGESDELFVDESGADSDSSAADSADALAADSTDIQNQVSPLFLKNRNPQGLAYAATDTSEINALLNDRGVRAILPSDLTFLWSVKPFPVQANSGVEGSLFELNAIKKGRTKSALLNGEVVIDARQEIDEQGRAVVSMRMNALGAKKWRKITGENVGKQIAIVLDDYVYSAPVVNGEIPNGSSQISGNFTIEEAQDLANILKAGKLPAPVRIVEEAVVGPSLGQEAQNQGLISIAAGLFLVVFFMIGYYSKGGLVADIALLINVFFIFGVLAQFQAALTLPGIAGIVLTIGMSIDANVLIFERIREEKEKGKNMLEAISDGYDRAFITILDANLTTFLTALFLYVLGSGPIRGFAITLMIGIVCSFFTAVWITRLIVSWMVKDKEAKNMSFNTGLSKADFGKRGIDFLGKRKIAYAVSGVIIAVGITMMATKGLNFGVDFEGGRSYVVEFKEAVSPSDMKIALSQNISEGGVEVKTYDTDNKVKITTSYLTEDESREADNKVRETVMKTLNDKYGDMKPEILSTAKVGATIADDIKNSAGQAALFSLAALFLYILVRFRKWQFGLGAVIALFHDTLVVLSFFSVAYALGIAFEIDQVFVAAMLTIIGYSINDTVVVFDRVREYLNLNPNREFRETLNSSINGTLNRTLITSLTTLIVVLILFIFGGEVLRGFSFALLVGILVGTYSSIFVATPVVLDTSGKALQESAKKEAAARAARESQKDDEGNISTT